MNSSNASEGPNKSPNKKRRFLTAEKKFQISLEAQSNDQPVGELPQFWMYHLRQTGYEFPFHQ